MIGKIFRSLPPPLSLGRPHRRSPEKSLFPAQEKKRPERHFGWEKGRFDATHHARANRFAALLGALVHHLPYQFHEDDRLSLAEDALLIAIRECRNTKAIPAFAFTTLRRLLIDQRKWPGHFWAGSSKNASHLVELGLLPQHERQKSWIDFIDFIEKKLGEKLPSIEFMDFSVVLKVLIGHLLKNPRSQEIAEIYYIDELSLDEITSITHFSKPTVSRHLTEFKKLVLTLLNLPLNVPRLPRGRKSA